MILILFVLFLYFIFFIKKDKTLFYIYNLAVILFVPFIGMKMHISAINLIYHIVPCALFVSILPFWRKYSRQIVFFFSILIFYLLFKFLLWDIDVIKLFAVFKNSLMCVCGYLAIIENYNRGLLNLNKFIKAIYLLLFVQLAIAIGQYLIPSVSEFFFVIEFEDGSGMEDFSRKLNNMKLISGTLISPSALACYLSSSIFVLSIFEINSNRVNVNKIVIALITLAVLFLTGIRTPLLMLLISFSIYLFLFQRKYFFYFLLVSLPVFGSLSVVAISETEGAIGRIFQGISMISNGIVGLQDSTLFYTIMMVPYFLSNPLFGVSLYRSTGYPLAFGVSLSDMSLTDVYLLYLLCEVGIIGVIIYLLPIIKMRRMMSASINKKLFSLIIIYGILLSIVDQGIFQFGVLVILLNGIVILAISSPLNNKNNI